MFDLGTFFMMQLIFKNNNTKQTVFLTPMVHVANGEFYQEIIKDIDLFNKNHPKGQIFFEQVSPKNTADYINPRRNLVDDFIGNLMLLKGFSLSNSYKTIASIFNLEVQSNAKLFLNRAEDFSKYENEKDFSKIPLMKNAHNIDVYIEDIEGILRLSGFYELSEEFLNYHLENQKENKQNKEGIVQKIKKIFKKHFTISGTGEVEDFNTVVELLKKRWLFKFLTFFVLTTKLNKTIPTLMIKNIFHKDFHKNENNYQQNFSIDKFNQENPVKNEEYYNKLKTKLFKSFSEIILYNRNNHLISHLKKELKNNNDFYIVYGAMHFSPFLPKEFNIIEFLKSQGFEQVEAKS